MERPLFALNLLNTVLSNQSTGVWSRKASTKATTNGDITPYTLSIPAFTVEKFEIARYSNTAVQIVIILLIVDLVK